MACAAGAANAATTYYASSVIDFDQGTCKGPLGCEAGRSNPANALYAPDDTFVSLGFGGALTLGFDTSFDALSDISVWEVTYSAKNGNPPGDNHREAIEVYTVLGGTETLVGTLLNYGSNTVMAAGAFDYIKLVDITLSYFAGDTTSFDGFDVDAVSVTMGDVAPVPLPASGLLLMAGIGGMAYMRRRKTAA